MTMDGAGGSSIGNGRLTARVAAQGAELVSLVPAWGGELIWQADPAIWPWHAPNLFPIVGSLAEDTLIHRGRRYRLTNHGFLRESRTSLVSQGDDAVSYRLTDSAETRQRYPFAFALTIAYRLDGDRLVQTFTVDNPAADEPLLVSLGAHPAFRWPLVDGAARTAHRLVFDRTEPQGIHRVAPKGLSVATFPTPVQGRLLPLDDSLFQISAVVWDDLASRRVTYGLAGGPGIEMEFADFPHFGLWTKPGAPFLCLEPWQGHMSPEGFAGELADKPGIVAIPAGGSRSWTLSIRPVERWPADI